jgi:NAD+ kinase
MPDQSIVRTVGILSKPRSESAAALLPRLISWLTDRAVTVLLDEQSAIYLAASEGASAPEGLVRTNVAAQADLLVVLGGDGTLLSAARASVGHDVAIFAVNLGGLGFLTAVQVEDLYPQLELALHGALQTEQRLMLGVEIQRKGETVATYDGLNDLVLAKTEIARIIDLEVYLDGNFVCVYKADGLIIATPTGSTAYSLSAGGPIVLPTVHAFSVTPICPHTLTNRPVIVPDSSVIEIGVRGEGSTYLTIDGQIGKLLQSGDRVVCRKSQFRTRLIRPADLLFFDVLREKLKWGGR